MSNRYADAAANASARTNRELAGEMARLTSLTEREIERLLPTKIEKEQFAEILAIVGDATSTNAKVAALRQNINQLGPVLIKVLRAAIIA